MDDWRVTGRLYSDGQEHVFVWIRVGCFRTSTPGLVVHGRVGGTAVSLSHVSTGLMLGFFPDYDAAHRAAQGLGQLCDWTAERPDGSLRDAVAAVIETAGGVRTGETYPGDLKAGL